MSFTPPVLGAGQPLPGQGTDKIRPENILLSPWQYVGERVPFQGVWTNYGGVYVSARFKKTVDNMVAIEGLVKATGSFSFATGGYIFTLPLGYVPKKWSIFPCLAYDPVAALHQVYRVTVRATGEVHATDVIQGGSASGQANTWISLNTIYFGLD